MRETIGRAGLGRRQFLQLGSAGLLALAGGLSARAAEPAFPVGISHTHDPYAATLRAIDASQSWNPSWVAGRRVIIKPNLVIAERAESGAVTDPQVTRAVVDLALSSGASQVLIVESGPDGAPFDPCGYGFFRTYDPGRRVALVDLAAMRAVAAPVPGGRSYSRIDLPALLFGDDAVLVSVAKLKVHVDTLVSLSMKNLVGLPPQGHYALPHQKSRFAMHERDINQVVLDLNLARPIDFAVVDGIWGMETTGPWGGEPARMNLVVAGANALAVDMVCAAAIGVPLHRARHLAYAIAHGLGPASLRAVSLRGDTLAPRDFTLPDLPPLLSQPLASPGAFRPGAGQSCAISYYVDSPCLAQVEIVELSDRSPLVREVRVLRPWSAHPQGSAWESWDGRDAAGRLVPPSLYGIRLQARNDVNPRSAYALGWVTVAGAPRPLPEEEVRDRLYLPQLARS